MTPKENNVQMVGLVLTPYSRKVRMFFPFPRNKFSEKASKRTDINKIDTKLKLVHKDSETSIPIASSRLPQCPLLHVDAIILFLERGRLAMPLLQLGASYLGALTWSLNSFIDKGLR